MHYHGAFIRPCNKMLIFCVYWLANTRDLMHFYYGFKPAR